MELNANISAVVTGGASGLGEATARKLAALGVKVGIIDMNEEKGQALAKELGGAFAKVNVTSDEEVARGFAEHYNAICITLPTSNELLLFRISCLVLRFKSKGIVG